MAALGVAAGASAQDPTEALDPRPENPVHPPVRISSNADYTAANGVRRGSGTAEDPYVIANWTFVVQGSPNPIFAVHSSVAAGVVIENADAHVVLRDNLFLSTYRSDNGVLRFMGESTAGVIVDKGASNVTVADNRFQDVGGGDLGALSVLGNSRNVDLVGNTFRDGDRPSIVVRGSEAQVVDNDVQAYSDDCCINYENVHLVNVKGDTDVVGNRIRTDCGGYFGCGHHGLTFDGIVTDQVVRVANNTITGEFNGIVLGAGYDDPKGAIHVVNNTVDFEQRGWHCLWFKGHDGIVEGNTFRDCGDGLAIDPQVQVGRNRFRGGITLDISGRRNATVDPEPDRVTWFRGGQAHNVTLRDAHLAATGGFGWATNLTLENLTVEGALRWEGDGFLDVRNVTLAEGNGLRLFPHEADVTLRNVTVDGGEEGAHVEAEGPATLEVADSRFRNATDEGLHLLGLQEGQVTGTTFRNNSMGIRVNQKAEDVTVRRSSFLGNGYGVTTEVGLPVDAEDNWWGHPSGPEDEDNPDGQGDAVLGPVDYEPWLESPP